MIPKICDWAKYHYRHSSKSIRGTKLSFCQNDPLWYVTHSQILGSTLYSFFFPSKHQNIAEFKNLDRWLWSSDFLDLCNLIDLSCLCSITGLNNLYSPISPKNNLKLVIGWFLAPKWSILVLFVEWIIKNLIVYWYLKPFLLEAVEASLCYVFNTGCKYQNVIAKGI